MFKNFSRIFLKLVGSSLLFTIQAQAWEEQYCAPTCEETLCCEPCCERFWIEGEYLYWQINDSPEPVPLVISGPDPLTIALDAPGVSVVLGGKNINTNWRSGGKLSLGYWFDDACCFGVEGNYFALPNVSKTSQVSSSGLPGSEVLAIPYFNVSPGVNAEDNQPVAAPGIYAGLAKLKLSNSMQGAEINALMHSTYRVYDISFLAGFRYWNFKENLSFHMRSPTVVDPDIFQSTDKFNVTNQFYGGQIGAGITYDYQQYRFTAKGKVALGLMHEEVDIKGEFITNNFDGFGAPITYQGGFFALPTNIGNHKHNRFAVIPEAELKIAYQATDALSVQVGYTFLYVSKVVRAGNQIDRNINATQSRLILNTASAPLVGIADPKPFSKNSDLWAQGVNVGVKYNF